MADVRLEAEIIAKVDKFTRELAEATKSLKNLENQSDKTTNDVNKNSNKLKSGLDSLGKSIVGAFAIGSIIAFGKQMLNITAEFEKFNAVLTNTLGSKQAAEATLTVIRDFAAKTPFAVNELTASFVKLANQGFTPTTSQLRKLGDLASSTGKSFDQLTEAILDAQQGEFERLKEFGIRAQDNGDKVTFTFKGVQTQVEKTSSSIRQYITNLGDAEGVTGSMAAISETLTGQISNLGDAWDRALVSFGNRTSGVFKDALSNITKLINRISEVNENIQNAEKVGQKKGFFADYIDRVKSLFAGRTSQTDATGQLVTQQKQLFNGIANQAIEGAKSAADFDKALLSLAEAYKKQAERAGSSSTYANATKLAFDEAKALVESQKKSFEQAKKNNGNFGKGKDKDRNGRQINVPLRSTNQLFPDENRLTTLIDIQEKLITSNTTLEAQQDSISKGFKAIDEVTASLTESIGSGLTNAFAQLFQGSAAGFAEFGKMILSLISRIAAAIVVAYILAAALSAIPGFGAVKGSSLVSGLSGLSGLGGVLGGKLPGFANGGVVSKPTLAMIGEGREPEIIAPKSDFMDFARNQSGGNMQLEPVLLPNGILLKAVERGIKEKGRIG